MKKEIDIFENIKEIQNTMQKFGIIVTKADKINFMAFNWGLIGVQWEKPIFTIFVRENRFTRHQLDKNPEFTISLPRGKFDKNILKISGSTSGFNKNKVEELNLNFEKGKVVSTPAIKELPLTIECKVIYRQKQNLDYLNINNKDEYYPQDVDSSFHGSNKDCHIAYYGEILSTYVIE